MIASDKMGAKMLQTQHYYIKKNGVIKSGRAQYTVDLDTGAISYQATVEAGVFFFTKTYNFEGQYLIEPELLKSDRLDAIGDELQVGNVRFTVREIIDGLAHVDMQVEGKEMSGQAVIDIAGEYIRVPSMFANAKVGGFNLVLDVQEAPGR